MRKSGSGKLLGPFNLLDVLIIAGALLVVIPMLHYYLKFNEKGLVEQKLLERHLNVQKRVYDTVQGAVGTIEIPVSFKKLKKEDIANIKVGDKEVLPGGEVLTEITWVGRPEPNYYYIINLNAGPYEFHTITTDDGTYSLPAKVKIRGYVEKGTLHYKGSVANTLAPFEFMTPDYAYTFVVETWPYNTHGRYGQ